MFQLQVTTMLCNSTKFHAEQCETRIFSLLDGLEPICYWQGPVRSHTMTWHALHCHVTLDYGIGPIRTPHACHIVFGGHRIRELAIVKQRLWTALPLQCKVAAYWIQEVRADIKLLYKWHSYPVHFAIDHAKCNEITNSTSDAADLSIYLSIYLSTYFSTELTFQAISTSALGVYVCICV